MGLHLHRKNSFIAMAMLYSRKMGNFSQKKKKKSWFAMVWTKYLS